MSDNETEEIPVEEEESIEEESITEKDSRPVKPPRVKKDSPVGKNPNRVKQGFKLAAIGQKAKEEKMRQRVKNEMVKPTTWIAVAALLASIGFGGLYFLPLFKTESLEEKNYELPKEEKKPKSRNYFE